MGASNHEKSAESVSPPPATAPDELIKDLELQVGEEDQDKIKGGASDIFAKIGDIKGESRR